MQLLKIKLSVISAALVLIGAGCISSSNIIQRNIADYEYDGQKQSGIDKQGEISFTTESTGYTSKAHTVELAVFTGATSGDIDTYIQQVFQDEEGDEQKFSELAAGVAQVYYRREQNQNANCFFLWPSGTSMVMMRGVACDVQDALIKAYIKKLPPRMILK